MGRRLLYGALRQPAGDGLEPPSQQAGHIEHVLRLEFLSRPLAIRLELQTYKVPYITVNTVLNGPLQLALGMADPDYCIVWNRSVELDAGAGGRNVLQQGRDFVPSTGLVFPADIDQIRTKHSGFGTLTQHIQLIGKSAKNFRSGRD